MNYLTYRERIQAMANATGKAYRIFRSGAAKEGFTFMPHVRARDGLAFDVVHPR